MEDVTEKMIVRHLDFDNFDNYFKNIPNLKPNEADLLLFTFPDYILHALRQNKYIKNMVQLRSFDFREFINGNINFQNLVFT